jgi:hypothetical protein
MYIATALLTEMPKYLDRLAVYNHIIYCNPFLLLNRHHSRMMLFLLEYINKKENKCFVSFGVPYATH